MARAHQLQFERVCISRPGVAFALVPAPTATTELVG